MAWVLARWLEPQDRVLSLLLLEDSALVVAMVNISAGLQAPMLSHLAWALQLGLIHPWTPILAQVAARTLLVPLTVAPPRLPFSLQPTVQPRLAQVTSTQIKVKVTHSLFSLQELATWAWAVKMHVKTEHLLRPASRQPNMFTLLAFLSV
jgi:hypothetical protein